MRPQLGVFLEERVEEEHGEGRAAGVPLAWRAVMQKAKVT